MNLTQKIRKLSRMGAGEVVGRVNELFDVARLKRWYKDPGVLLGKRYPSLDDVTANCCNLVPGTQASELSKLCSSHPLVFETWSKDARDRAEQLLSGDLGILGKRIPIGLATKWNTDPISGFSWDRKFFGQVSYSAIPDDVDFKYVWEIARHQYLVELTRASLLCGDDRYAVFALDILRDWIHFNPFGEGIHWTSGLEVAMRSISWIWSLGNLSQRIERGRDDLSLVVKTLGLHGFYLERRMSYYFSPFNHIIGEATGLYLIAVALGDFPESQRWKSLARKVLSTYAKRQFYGDGFSAEQATGYHYFTLGFLTLAQLAANRTSDSSLDLRDVILNAFRTGKLFRRPSGSWAAIGDVDSASSIPVARDQFFDFSALHRLAACAFGEPDLDVPCEVASPEAYWLLGHRGLVPPTPVRDRASAGTHLLPDSGYFIASDEKDWVLFDSGSVAQGLHSDGTPSTAHGHADTLQILFDFDREAILVDGGMPNYAGDRPRAAHFRSPAAHNTVQIEGVEFVRSTGLLSWSNEVERPSLDTSSHSRYWIASGNVRWDQAEISRHLLFIPGDGLWVADHVVGPEGRQVNWIWQFDSELQRSSTSGGFCLGNGLSIQAFTTGSVLQSDLTRASESDFRGWRSPSYGELVPASTVEYRCSLASGLLVLTKIGRTDRGVSFCVNDLEVHACEKPSNQSSGSATSTEKITASPSGIWIISSSCESDSE